MEFKKQDKKVFVSDDGKWRILMGPPDILELFAGKNELGKSIWKYVDEGTYSDMAAVAAEHERDAQEFVRPEAHFVPGDRVLIDWPGSVATEDRDTFVGFILGGDFDGVRLDWYYSVGLVEGWRAGKWVTGCVEKLPESCLRKLN